MKYWLLIALFDYNGQFAGKIWQGPFPDREQCIVAQYKLEVSKGDPSAKARCYTDDHKNGRTVDPGPRML